jgi:hypothetical protein
VPLCLGTAAGLGYDLYAAHRFHEGLVSFLRSGSTGYYAGLARAARRGLLLDWSWLGSSLRLVLAFAVVYAVLRLVLRRHVHAASAAWIVAVIWSFAGPWFAARVVTTHVGPFASTESTGFELGSAFVLLGCLTCPEEDAPRRVDVARLLVWAALPTAAWLYGAGYDPRLLSPAWPPLILLIAISLTTGVIGLRRLRPELALAPLALVIALGVVNYYSIDSLGPSGFHQLRALGSKLFDESATSEVVLPGFAGYVHTVEEAAGPGGRVFSSDGRLRFFFPGRMVQAYPSGCSSLNGFNAFVLLTDGTSTNYLQTYFHLPATEKFWASCRNPRLIPTSVSPDGEIVFKVKPGS